MDTVGLGLFFEDLPLGRQFRTVGRTVTEADIVNFVGCTGMVEVLFTDLEFLRLHYAKTLAHWCRRFEANRAKIAAMYDERFCRMWEFYLISAEMMFRTGSQLVFQMQLARRRDAAPIVRDYITDTQRRYQAIDALHLGAVESKG